MTYAMFVLMSEGPHEGWRFEGLTTDPGEVEQFRNRVGSDIEMTKDSSGLRTLAWCVTRLESFSFFGEDLAP